MTAPALGPKLRHDLSFTDLYDRDGLVRLDAAFVDWLKAIDDWRGSAQECARAEGGEVSGRNSCRGPWATAAGMSSAMDRNKVRMPRRGAVQFSASNPRGAADLALHGSDKRHGWGMNNSPD